MKMQVLLLPTFIAAVHGFAKMETPTWVEWTDRDNYDNGDSTTYLNYEGGKAFCEDLGGSLCKIEDMCLSYGIGFNDGELDADVAGYDLYPGSYTEDNWVPFEGGNAESGDESYFMMNTSGDRPCYTESVDMESSGWFGCGCTNGPFLCCNI